MLFLLFFVGCFPYSNFLSSLLFHRYCFGILLFKFCFLSACSPPPLPPSPLLAISSSSPVAPACLLCLPAATSEPLPLPSPPPSTPACLRPLPPPPSASGRVSLPLAGRAAVPRSLPLAQSAPDAVAEAVPAVSPVTRTCEHCRAHHSGSASGRIVSPQKFES